MVESAITDFGQLVHCPFCHAVIRNHPGMAWQMARCPTCQNQFVMPGTPESPIAQPVDTFGPAHWATASIQEPLPPIEEPAVPDVPSSGPVSDQNTRPELAAARRSVLPVAAPATAASVPAHIVRAVQAACTISAEAAPLPSRDVAELQQLAVEPDDEAEDDSPVQEMTRNAPAWVISLMMHAAVLIVLGMFTLAVEIEEYIDLDLSWNERESLSLDTTEFKLEVQDPAPVTQLVNADPVPVEPDPFAAPPELPVTPLEGLLPSLEFSAGTIGVALEGRGPAARMTLVAKNGGTPESEAAVGKGLEWLNRHQMANGSWQFDMSRAPQCRGKCRHPGGARSETGSTALALLPFLGAGQTHQEGKYKTTVRRGLYYLANQVKKNGGARAGDLQGQAGNMYCHGLASIALCEAYAMTQDAGLKHAAQKSLEFIVFAQDEQGGGWRYGPGQSGDTSVVGWQLMALKSGHMAYLEVPPKTIQRAEAFLDSVASYDGAMYGYTAPGQGRATTSIGLLCRMYLGWKKDHPGLERGIAALDGMGPSDDDMYYNYYATQVMHHWGGREWKRWNGEMRDYLIGTQSKQGHESGSWYIPHHWNHSGGRIYNTSLAILTLEVYYRHLPIYKQNSVKDDFK